MALARHGRLLVIHMQATGTRVLAAFVLRKYRNVEQ